MLSTCLAGVQGTNAQHMHFRLRYAPAGNCSHELLSAEDYNSFARSLPLSAKQLQIIIRLLTTTTPPEI